MNTPAWAFSGLGVVLGLLVIVYFVDARAHRWFQIGGMKLMQPSEFAKPALILFLAYFVSRRLQAINDRRTLRQAFVAVAMLAVLVVVADLGTALVPVITAVSCSGWRDWSGATWLRVAMLGAALVFLAVISKPLRMDRMITYLRSGLLEARTGRSARDGSRRYLRSGQRSRDASYQPRQSKIAVGTGRRARSRPDAGQTETDVPAGRAHRFYLRDGRRRIGAVGMRPRCSPDSW